MGEFLSFTIAGIVTGSVYSVAATGLVVTYTTSGIFNIAHGGIGMLMAFLYWQLRVGWHWPAPLAMILVVFVLAPLFGAGLERGVIRGLRGASVATSLVITVAIMVFLVGVANILWDPTVARELPGFFEPSGVQLGGILVTWHEIITVLAGGVVAAFLYALLSRTRVGIAMRAVVDDRNLLAMNGAQPNRVSMLSWAIGASLASIAGILLAPVLQMNVLILTLLVVNAYAAAMVGRLSSLPMTFVGGFTLGLIEAYVIGYINLSGPLLGLREALPTLFLFVALLTLPEARLRTARLAGAVGPRLPTYRKAFAGFGVLIAVTVIVSGMLQPADISRTALGLAYGLIMLSLIPLVGFAGQVSLCQMTFAGLGAFAMARMGADGNLIGIVAALVLAGAVGAIVALPSLRLQGLYLALSTMAFAVLMDKMVFSNEHVFGNLGALNIPRLDLLGVSFDGERAYMILLSIMFGVFGTIVIAIRRGRFGRRLAAMRDSQVACATLGLSLARTKLTVFMISAAMAGVAGALYGGLAGSAGGVDFLMFQSLPVILLAVVGGITTVFGSLIGGVLYALLLYMQSKFPALNGLVFMIVGAGALSLGRNPNGLSFFITQQVRRVLPKEPANPPAAAPPPIMEEVSGIAATAG
ncbi:MAG: ABC transporter permease [Actinomycetota bacterium]|nr:ABC transporter permease [Actinomycetota bacterium]